MTGRSGLCDPRQVPAAFDNNFGEGSDDDDQHGQRRQVLPAKHPVDSGPGSRHQFDIVSETRIFSNIKNEAEIVAVFIFANNYRSSP